jgi:hypothetical protein
MNFTDFTDIFPYMYEYIINGTRVGYAIAKICTFSSSLFFNRFSLAFPFPARGHVGKKLLKGLGHDSRDGINFF